MAGVDTDAVAPAGLTTTRAPFIEQAQNEGQLYIHQPFELYSEANHDAWRRLYARMEGPWRKYANPRFLQGIDTEFRVQRVGQAPRQHAPARPVHDRHQV